MPASFARALLDRRDRRSASSPPQSSEVGDRAGALWREAFGTLTFDAGSPPATRRHDLRSRLADQAVATTTVVMELVAGERLRLDEPIAVRLRRVARRGSRGGHRPRSARARVGTPGAARRSAAERTAASSSTRSARCRSSTTRARNRSTAISASSCSGSSSADRGRAHARRAVRRAFTIRATGTCAADVRCRLTSRARQRVRARRVRWTTTSGVAGRSPARCTTTTRRRSAASPATPGCSAPRAPSARSRAPSCAARAATTSCPRRSLR